MDGFLNHVINTLAAGLDGIQAILLYGSQQNPQVVDMWSDYDVWIVLRSSTRLDERRFIQSRKGDLVRYRRPLPGSRRYDSWTRRYRMESRCPAPTFQPVQSFCSGTLNCIRLQTSRRSRTSHFIPTKPGSTRRGSNTLAPSINSAEMTTSLACT